MLLQSFSSSHDLFLYDLRPFPAFAIFIIQYSPWFFHVSHVMTFWYGWTTIANRIQQREEILIFWLSTVYLWSVLYIRMIPFKSNMFVLSFIQPFPFSLSTKFSHVRSESKKTKEQTSKKTGEETAAFDTKICQLVKELVTNRCRPTDTTNIPSFIHVQVKKNYL